MKLTKLNGQIIEVKGCTSCPHKVDVSEGGGKFMRCEMKIKLPGGKFSNRKKKLVGNWAGAYHASCPLSSDASVTPQEVVR